MPGRETTTGTFPTRTVVENERFGAPRGAAGAALCIAVGKPVSTRLEDIDD